MAIKGVASVGLTTVTRMGPGGKISAGGRGPEGGRAFSSKSSSVSVNSGLNRSSYEKKSPFRGYGALKVNSSDLSKDMYLPKVNLNNLGIIAQNPNVKSRFPSPTSSNLRSYPKIDRTFNTHKSSNVGAVKFLGNKLEITPRALNTEKVLSRTSNRLDFSQSKTKELPKIREIWSQGKKLSILASPRNAKDNASTEHQNSSNKTLEVVNKIKDKIHNKHTLISKRGGKNKSIKITQEQYLDKRNQARAKLKLLRNVSDRKLKLRTHEWLQSGARNYGSISQLARMPDRIVKIKKDQRELKQIYLGRTNLLRRVGIQTIFLKIDSYPRASLQHVDAKSTPIIKLKDNKIEKLFSKSQRLSLAPNLEVLNKKPTTLAKQVFIADKEIDEESQKAALDHKINAHLSINSGAFKLEPAVKVANITYPQVFKEYELKVARGKLRDQYLPRQVQASVSLYSIPRQLAQVRAELQQMQRFDQKINLQKGRYLQSKQSQILEYRKAENPVTQIKQNSQLFVELDGQAKIGENLLKKREKAEVVEQKKVIEEDPIAQKAREQILLDGAKKQEENEKKISLEKLRSLLSPKNTYIQSEAVKGKSIGDGSVRGVREALQGVFDKFSDARLRIQQALMLNIPVRIRNKVTSRSARVHEWKKVMQGDLYKPVPHTF